MLAVTLRRVASTVWRWALRGLEGLERCKNHREYLSKYG
jgi:hypothetical protein